jgi:hypothetical protein
MPVVELVYDADCPSVGRAREQLLRAFARAGLEARWREWRADDPEAPAHVRGFGSPTILVDRRDVAGAEQVVGARSCRLYGRAGDELRGAPSVALIIAALLRSGRTESAGNGVDRGSWNASTITMLPTLGAALLPKATCPACWPAYAGFLSSIGLAFLLDTAVLAPLTGAFLAVSVFALAFRSSRRRGYGPFAVGLVAAAIVLVGKFVLESDAALYGGLAVLVAASVWNSWPVRREADARLACVHGESALLP